MNPSQVDVWLRVGVLAVLEVVVLVLVPDVVAHELVVVVVGHRGGVGELISRISLQLSC